MGKGNVKFELTCSGDWREIERLRQFLKLLPHNFDVFIVSNPIPLTKKEQKKIDELLESVKRFIPAIKFK